MKFELEAHVAYKVTITNLELVPAESDVWKGLLRDSKLNNPNSVLDEEEFEDQWSTEVARTAIDMLPIHGSLEGAHFYLGHFNEDNQPQVAVLGKEMDNYGADDITYNGWRVTATCHEGAWDYS